MIQAITIFLGSFFAFFVQPLIGNSLLPVYGGTATVWSLCLAGYQLLLVGGYFYAHLVTGVNGVRRGRLYAHATLLVLLAGMLFVFRGRLLPSVLVAAATYLLLSANSSLVQVLSNGRYELYAFSNLGSLCGLFAYPFYMEPHHSSSANWCVFACGVALYAVCLIGLILSAGAEPVAGNLVSKNENKRSEYRPLRCFALSATSCYLLNSVSTHLCMDVSPLPMLWTVILGFYLLSYVFAFSDRWSRFVPAGGILFFAAVALWLSLYYQNGFVKFLHETSCGLAILFFGGYIIHVRLYRSRPSAEKLTGFYLMLALGGAFGGGLSSFVMPLVSNSVVEYPIAVAVVAAILVRSVGQNGLTRLLSHVGAGVSPRRLAIARIGTFGVLAALLALGMWRADRTEGKILLAIRNFYGTGRVVVNEIEDRRAGVSYPVIEFESSCTVHGLQYRSDGGNSLMPTTYYAAHAGGAALSMHPKARAHKPMRVALCGMGIGTLATYARKGDSYRFYEINPAVVAIATNESFFTFVPRARGKVDIVVDDARLALERERERGDAKYDVIVVDVFTGDSIPAHMATKEAFALYLDRLNPDGILAFHLSNWHLNLFPIVKAASREFGLNLEMMMSKGRNLAFPALWAFLSREKISYLVFDSELQMRIGADEVRDMRLMTDDFHSLFPFLAIYK